MNPAGNSTLDGIAIIGMNGRFPGARNLGEFWGNLCAGVESIRAFSEAEMTACGYDPAVLQQPNFVNAGAPLDDAEMFDAPFFVVTPREAQSLDPQRRVFLECAWHALEDAGYVPENVDGPIGIFAGNSLNSYMHRVQANPEIVAAVGGYQVMIGNDKDHLTTYTAYKLNLTGPAVTVQTACSTSLVAASMACQSLLNHECDLALAGGVSIRGPQHKGYFYEEGGVMSPDGHCRAFDAAAQGTVSGNGVGIVVLKRLEDAVRDGDRIRAVILASAINNDGSQKVGYTAPSVEGQAAVITTAMTLAGVEPETITYIESHGTATPLGDPIEVSALTQAFGTSKRNFCALASIKTNIGHLDVAAGVTGLIKAALCLEHKMLPPSLHFQMPNPAIDFENSPFYVQNQLTEWKPAAHPRRAGISSFGIGGTNAHMVLEEAPEREPSSESRAAQILIFSARSEAALERMTENLLFDLQNAPPRPLADIAFTLAAGRRHFLCRRCVACQDRESAIEALRDAQNFFTSVATEHSGMVFMFPGQGSQCVGMGRELYEGEPRFREEVDRCAHLLEKHLGCDIRQAIFGGTTGAGATDDALQQTWLAQPALFTIEYALARLLMSWEITPAAMIGHSIGEYVAACLAGVFSLEDALELVAVRGKLMQTTEAGGMLATFLSEEAALAMLPAGVGIAAVNGPGQTILSGREAGLRQAEDHIQKTGGSSVRLRTSHAFHSETMNSILDEFHARVRAVGLRPPTTPYISNLTGTWQTEAAATEPRYWVDHLRQAVRFGDGCRALCEKGHKVWLEVGPGGTLSKLATRFLREREGMAIESGLDQHSIAMAAGKLWATGVPVSWPKYYEGERRCRVPLPLYPFEWQSYDAEPAAATSQISYLSRNPDLKNWFYLPAWRQTRPPQPLRSETVCLLFLDESGLGAAAADQLRDIGARIIKVEAGTEFQTASEDHFYIRAEEPQDYSAMFNALAAAKNLPQHIIHFWNVGAQAEPKGSGFYPLLYLAQALASRPEPMRVTVVSNHVHAVTGYEEIHPMKATVLGFCRVAQHEQPNLTWRNVDVEWPAADAAQQVAAECTSDSIETAVAWRGRGRWAETIEPTPFLPTSQHGSLLRPEGVYLITGGLGGIGLSIAQYLVRQYRARLVLVGRSPLPEDSPKRQQITALEQEGAEILVCAADVADSTQMSQVLQAARERFGPLNGVIHSAGVAGGGMIQVKERAAAEAVFSPKVQGALVLEELLRETKLDFFAVFSSLAALLGGFGQADYCAANCFLDAFAHREAARRDRVTLSIQWDTWDEVGMAVNTVVPAEMEGHRAQALRDAIHPAEGAAAFHWAIESGLPRVAISTTFLPWRVEQARAMLYSQTAAAAQAAPPADRHPRPQLRSTFIAPASEMEQLVAGIWQDLLGIEQVGTGDNFFELGGHSLLATQMVSRLRSALGVEISVRKIFEVPTIAGLVKALNEMMNESDEVLRMIAMVEQMSDEQVKTQLEQME
ncbi:MAG TPA: SDR family NAD(P)-dependent oxidoreductase [Candidatus Angelobacter sp.]|jgi:acyl transferase domain-containing protein/acyl carrier protein|nr:SDR family NAD(P)-dependent oxidoreductase [Candidatus Angelobacter sp.]